MQDSFLKIVAIQFSRKVQTEHLTHFFLCSVHALSDAHHTAQLKTVFLRVMSSTCSSMSCVRVFFDSLFLALFLSVCFSYPFFYLNLVLNLFLHVVDARAITGNPSTEESGTLAENNPLTGYEPNFIDNYQISETTEIFIWESSSDSSPQTCMTWRSMTTPSAERSLHHCSLPEREDTASRRQAYHSSEESLLHISRCLSVL